MNSSAISKIFSIFPHMEEILDIARWAPSGDNNQPWEFEVIDADHVRVHITPDLTNVYEYNNGQPSFISCGILIETIAIAASKFGRQCVILNIVVKEQQVFTVDLDLSENQKIQESDLLAFVKTRSVNRFPYKTRSLSVEAKEALENAVGRNFEITWFTTLFQKLEVVSLNCKAGDVRLRIPEAFPTHHKMFDYDQDFSQTRIPIKAIGASKPTMKFMRWMLQKWSRVDFMNRFMAGTIAPQIEFDFIPGVRCAAHFLLFYKKSKGSYAPEELIEAGRAMQRFWLVAEKYGLVLQPSFSTLAYASYAKNGEDFTIYKKCAKKARKLYQNLQEVFPVELDQVMFMGRIGSPNNTSKEQSRSTRKPLSDLMYKP